MPQQKEEEETQQHPTEIEIVFVSEDGNEREEEEDEPSSEGLGIALPRLSTDAAARPDPPEGNDDKPQSTPRLSKSKRQSKQPKLKKKKSSRTSTGSASSTGKKTRIKKKKKTSVRKSSIPQDEGEDPESRKPPKKELSSTKRTSSSKERPPTDSVGSSAVLQKPPQRKASPLPGAGPRKSSRSAAAPEAALVVRRTASPSAAASSKRVLRGTSHDDDDDEGTRDPPGHPPAHPARVRNAAADQHGRLDGLKSIDEDDDIHSDDGYSDDDSGEEMLMPTRFGEEENEMLPPAATRFERDPPPGQKKRRSFGLRPAVQPSSGKSKKGIRGLLDSSGHSAGSHRSKGSDNVFENDPWWKKPLRYFRILAPHPNETKVEEKKRRLVWVALVLDFIAAMVSITTYNGVTTCCGIPIFSFSIVDINWARTIRITTYLYLGMIFAEIIPVVRNGIPINILNPMLGFAITIAVFFDDRITEAVCMWAIEGAAIFTEFWIYRIESREYHEKEDRLLELEDQLLILAQNKKFKLKMMKQQKKSGSPSNPSRKSSSHHARPDPSLNQSLSTSSHHARPDPSLNQSLSTSSHHARNGPPSNRSLSTSSHHVRPGPPSNRSLSSSSHHARPGPPSNRSLSSSSQHSRHGRSSNVVRKSSNRNQLDRPRSMNTTSASDNGHASSSNLSLSLQSKHRPGQKSFDISERDYTTNEIGPWSSNHSKRAVNFSSWSTHSQRGGVERASTRSPIDVSREYRTSNTGNNVTPTNDSYSSLYSNEAGEGFSQRNSLDRSLGSINDEDDDDFSTYSGMSGISFAEEDDADVSKDLESNKGYALSDNPKLYKVRLLRERRILRNEQKAGRVQLRYEYIGFMVNLSLVCLTFIFIVTIASSGGLCVRDFERPVVFDRNQLDICSDCRGNIVDGICELCEDGQMQCYYQYGLK